MEETESRRLTKWSISLLVLVLAAGIFLRIWPSAGFKSVGVDEHQYAVYAAKAVSYGITNYGRVIDEFIVDQVHKPGAVVPATRIGFIWPMAMLSQLTKLDPLQSARVLSCAATILLLGVSVLVGLRFGRTRQAITVAALLSTAPLQICLAQRSLVDGYFAFLAILCSWLFFESTQAPRSRIWPIAYGVTLFVLVLTKENAAFVCAALIATWICLCAIQKQRPNPVLLLVTFVAGAAGVIVLASLLGGITEWITYYRMYARKSAAIPYVIQFQDGAWYRYIIDFTLLSPPIVALFFARVINIDREARADLFWAIFLGFSFFAMSFVRYGFNLRFAAYWDEPLRWLAASQLVLLSGRVSSRWRDVILVIAVIAVMAIDLLQYHRFFVRGGIYDPVSSHLLHESNLVK